MKQATKDAVQTILQNDPTVDNRNIGPAFDVLNGKTSVQMLAGAVDLTVSRRDAAKIIGVSIRMVDDLGRRGRITRAMLTGKDRAHGYSLASIRKYQSERLVRK